MSKNTKSIFNLSTSDIKRLYNIGKIIRAKELPELAKTYKDNFRTLIVYMDRKTTKPEQMPEWFKKWNKEVFEPFVRRFSNLETLVYTMIKVNKLKIN